MNSNKNYEKIIRNLKERNREVLDRCIHTNIRNLSLDYEIIKLRNQIDTYQKTLDEVTSEKMELEDKICEIDKYVGYLREFCSYRLNKGHLRHIHKIIDGDK